MTDLWKYLDAEVSLTPMPEEYKDYKADILCKDCHEVKKNLFLHTRARACAHTHTHTHTKC